MGLPLAFLAPFALIGLVVLPAIWFFIRVTPPRPQHALFPPLKLILDMKPKDETPARTPWPLLLLRLAIAALAILAMAGPVWNPPAALKINGKAPLLILLDDGWAAAPTWDKRIAYAVAAVESAGRENAPTAILALSEGAQPLALRDAQTNIERLRAKKPSPFLPHRLAAWPAIEAFFTANPGARAQWVSDGLEQGDARAFAEKIAAKATAFEIIADDRPTLALAGTRNEPGGLIVRVLRAGSSAQGSSGVVRAYDQKSRSMGDAPFALGAQGEGEATFDLPIELRNDIARVEIPGEHSAGAVALLDDAAKRRRVGLVSGGSLDVAQPLLAPNYYLSKALSPFADVREAKVGAADPIGQLLDDGVNVLILADMVIGSGETREKIENFLDKGGVVIRFAGPRLAGSADDLTPVELRRGGRTLGGSLSWETPKKMGAFDKTSPFFGLRAPDEVTVSRQVLAEPEPGLSARTWAQLADQTPLVTAEKRGRGLLVLFHVTADTTWSNLPLSGLFPDMLRTLVALSGGQTAPDGAVNGAQAGATAPPQQKAEQLAPMRMMDGFGVLGPPSVTARAIPADFGDEPTAEHPPGYYGPPDAQTALNALSPDAKIFRADFSGLSVKSAALEEATPLDLRPPLLMALFFGLLLDALAALWLSQGSLRLRRQSAIPGVLIAALLGLALPYPSAEAQSSVQSPPAPPIARTDAAPGGKEPSKRDQEAALQTRLAFVLTGDKRVDEASKSGLAAVSNALAQRTALTPGEPSGVDPARDELAFYPLLYWPIVATRSQPDPRAVQKIAAYMKQGGTIVFDTRDALTARPGADPSPEALWLRKLLEGVDVPELEPVPKDHVVTKTFYLLKNFVGRSVEGQTWIEALPPEPDDGSPRPARAGDSVSPIIIASNDLATAWAADSNGEPLYPLGPGGARQREMAIRGGINLVMYTLTGNYKTDQVHVRDLLNRLGH